jgi:hypothetical protein
MRAVVSEKVAVDTAAISMFIVMQSANLHTYLTAEVEGGTRWRRWLRDYATNRKVAGLIPADAILIFL